MIASIVAGVMAIYVNGAFQMSKQGYGSPRECGTHVFTGNDGTKLTVVVACAGKRK